MPAQRLAALLCALGLAGAAAHGQEQNRYYNVKAGPVYITLSSGLSMEYTDNVNLSNGRTAPIEQELTITPNFGITALSQMQLFPEGEQDVTTLSLTMNFGYRDHIFHPELNENLTNINIAPDSELAFQIRTKHIKIRVHDGFSLQSDPVSDGSLSNVAQFRRFTNTFGIDATWAVNRMTQVNAAYAHRNVIALDLISLGASGQTTNLNTSAYDNYSDTVSASVLSRVLSFLSLGVSASVQATTYPSAPEQDSSSYSYGPIARIFFSDYTDLSLSWGLTQRQAGNIFTGSDTGNPGDGSTSQYVDATLTNRFNNYYTQSLSTGRQNTLNLIGTQTETNYVRYSSAWKINSLITLLSSIGVEDNTEIGGPNAGNHYKTLTASTGTQLRLSKKLTTSLNYRYVDKIADDHDQSYKQNTVIWQIDYRF